MIDLIVKEIRKKKEFQNLDALFVKSLIKKEYERVKDGLIGHVNPKKNKDFKNIIKNSRKILHDIYGVFNIDTKKRKEILEKIKKNPHNKDLHRHLLETHRSSKERLFFYENLYEKILSKKDKTILDIGCGLNPVSWIFMKNKPQKYIALELTNEDCAFLNDYFKAVKLNGKALRVDLLKVKSFEAADVCFIFKVLDSLEEVKKGISKEILNKLQCKKIIVSFPSRTLSGKGRIGTRRWFERLIKKFEKFEIENEIFYIINKENLY